MAVPQQMTPPPESPCCLTPKGKGLFREIRTKVLKINFWRPGDGSPVRETQVRTGVPELPNGPSLRPPFSGFGGRRSHPPRHATGGMTSRTEFMPFVWRRRRDGIQGDTALTPCPSSQEGEGSFVRRLSCPRLTSASFFTRNKGFRSAGQSAQAGDRKS